MARIRLNLSMNSCHPECSGFGAIANGINIGTVEFIILGSRKILVPKIESWGDGSIIGNLTGVIGQLRDMIDEG